MITLENIDEMLCIELDKMRDAANLGDSKKVELLGGRVVILAKNALLLARRRSQESETLFRKSMGGGEL